MSNQSIGLQPTEKKIYFVADVHLGLHLGNSANEREQAFIQWLNKAKKDAEAIFMLGDIFDFWFEYKHVIPRGFTRVLGKIAEIADSGIPIHFFTGNHDMWTFDYLEKELGLIVHKEPLEINIQGKNFFLAHGDGLGNGDNGYKRLKAIFSCRFLQHCFAFLHPRIGMGIAHRWSNHSRANKGLAVEFKPENDQLLEFAKQESSKKPEIDYFIFGHRHTPVQIELESGALFTIVGEWVNGREYAVFDGKILTLSK